MSLPNPQLDSSELRTAAGVRVSQTIGLLHVDWAGLNFFFLSTRGPKGNEREENCTRLYLEGAVV